MSRVVVLGLDGVSVSLLHQLVSDGVMPHCERLLREGALKPMESVHPPLSSVAWTSFFTGVNPGAHRIFGFFESQIDACDLWFQDLTSVRAPAIWEILQAAGKRTVSLNLPGTYPAPPFNGVMISGFIAPELSKSVYPKVLLPALQNLGYQLDIDCDSVRTNPELFWKQANRCLEVRARTFAAMLEHEPFDLFIGVLTETDRIQHFFFDAIEEPSHPQRQEVMQFYSRVDRSLGNLVSLCKDSDELIILADHGFCRIEQEIFVNHWLSENGYLVMKNRRPGAPFSEIDSAKSRAFAFDPGRIFLNIRGRQPDGCVDLRDAGKLIQELQTGLSEIRIKPPWSRTPVSPFSNIFRQDEIYRGPWTFLAPDLLLNPRDGFELKARFNTPTFSRLGDLTGMHTFEGAMLYVRGRTWPDVKPKIVDIAPTILSLLGLEIPKSLEGRPLLSP